ncbi:MAG: DUF4433 domain-containing protein, partial [Methylocystaceae bacterium]|nr:DUF4433 domain-containing protein [Methylocystaceae bacterium]
MVCISFSRVNLHPNPQPTPTHIFHITAIDNLAGIVAHQAVASKSVLGRSQRAYSNIAYQGAQGVRAVKQVPHPPGGTIHDYVPFYFAPRSPMLFTINQGNVAGCNHRQQDIAHLVTTIDAVVAANLSYVFYDFNATLGFATCFSQLQDLAKIDWPLF